MVELSRQLTELSSEDLALLLRKLQERRREGGAVPPEERLAGSGGDAPLSFAQRRMWFLDRLQPGNPAYNVAGALRLRGPLEAGRLGGALGEAVRRHGVLRSRIELREGEPVQVVDPQPASRLPRVDLSGLPPGRAERAARLWARREARRPFDLAAGGLLRPLLLRTGPKEHLLVVVFHHIVGDAWSLGILTDEVARVYAAGRRALAPLPLQYGDHARRERDLRRGTLLESKVDYWRRRLEGLPVLDVPTDRPRPAVRSFRGARRRLRFEPEVARQVKRLAEAEAATPFLVLLAALAALLGRYSGQEDFALGAPVANRRDPDVQGLVGLFTNTLVLRIDLSGEPSFRELLLRVRSVGADAFSHQDLPFEKLVEELAPERSQSQEPLVQAMLAFQPEQPLLELPGLDLELEDVGNGTAKLDLLFHLVGDDGYTGYLEYATDLFTATTAARLAEGYERLLAALLRAPDRKLCEAPLSPPSEYQQVLVEWNEAGHWKPSVTTLTRLLAAALERRAEAPVLSHRGRAWTGRELRRRADELAERLRGCGAGPEVRVAVCARRSPDLVAGLLAVLEVGGAYVPLDPAYPPERLAFMLADSGAALVLVDEETAGRLPEGGPPRLRLDGVAAALDPSPGRWSGPVTPDGLAYVVYTSGSTGRPKGVGIRHGSAAAFVAWAGGRFSRSELAGVLASTSICFDLSVFELFVPLVHGGKVILAEDALELPALAERDEVTLLNTVPSAADALARTGALPPSLLVVNLAGEPLRRDLVDRLAGVVPGCRVLNLYGPSEDTTYSTWTPVAPHADQEPTIGRPVSGGRAVLVDRGLRPVPLGAVGELCVGGLGLARGYLGRPGLTPERFVPDPWTLPGGPGERLYRTGDLGRQRGDGEIFFLGRSDHQVKLRGFRIELGEIEACLTAHPAVREAAVVLRGAAGGELLVAYVAPEDGGAAPEAEAIRSYLMRELPAPMVPARVVPLERLPRTPNGKVDRGALPAPERRPEDGAVRSEAEGLVAAVWSRLLDVSGVGADDDFFALGGHSLLALRMATLLEDAFGRPVPVGLLFEAPTVGALAHRLSMGELDEHPAPPLARQPPSETYPASFAQERLWFLDRLDPGTPAYNLPFSLDLRGELELAALAGALSAVSRRQEALRTRLPAADDHPVQVVDPPGRARLPVVDLRRLSEPRRRAELERVAEAEGRRGFDLTRGPLARAFVARAGERHHRLLLILHHAVADGASLEVLAREVGSAYAEAAEGRLPALPPLPVRYTDYATWQRRRLEGPVLEAALDRAVERLAATPRELALPLDRPRVARRRPRGAVQRAVLEDVTPARLDESGRRLGTTRFMLMAAILQAVLARFTGQGAFLIGTPFDGRERRELQEVVGLFVNTLPIRAEVTGAESFAELARRVRHQVLAAFRDRDLPFEKLVERLELPRDPARPPLLQVMLSEHRRREEPRFPGLDVEVLEGATGTPHLELGLVAVDRGDRLELLLEHDADLLEEVTARRMLESLCRLARAALEAPEVPVHRLPLLGHAERHQVLVDWSRTTGRLDAPLPHRWFEERADAAPDAVALVDRARTLSYGEVERRANRLAHRLRERRVGPGAVVAVSVPRAAESVVALLAILKAGAAYLPLDPDLPLDRRRFMVQDAGAVLWLPGRGEPSGDEAWAAVPRLDLDAEPPGAGREGRPAGGARAEDLAYVLYTSGSTGRPKGVAVSQGALGGLVAAALQTYGFVARDRVLQFASLSFDASAEEIFPSLAAGAALVLRDEGMLGSPSAFFAACARHRVTVLDLPTGFWHELASEMEVGSAALPPDVTVVIVGGEKAEGGRIERFRRAAGPGVRLFNGYGPTEGTVIAAVWRAGSLTASGEVPIGRPIPGSRVYLVDPWLQPVPPGVLGEIVLSGGNVARGYLGRPALTAESFAPEPFPEAPPGARLYRTGDLGRWLPSGEIEFWGRRDAQVKVRGMRVEPGEVATRLAGRPGVREVVVVPRNAGDGVSLHAYVVPVDGAELSPREILGALAREVPAYMVPATLDVLTELPRSVTGKIDRSALPSPGPAASWAPDARPPRGLVEETIAGLWAAVLGSGPPSVEDDFFAVGGHSLLATRLLARLGRSLGVELSVRDLFEEPTVAGLARRVEAVLASGSSPVPREAIPPAGEGPLALSHAQERIWLLERLDPGTTVYTMPATVRLAGSLDTAALARGLAHLVERHPSLRTVFREGKDGRPFQLVAPSRAPALPCVDLSRLVPHGRRREADAVGAAAAARPFDLVHGPLLACRLLRLAEDDHRLLVNVHHIAADGLSLALLLDDLLTAYAALAAGERPERSVPGPSYADFAAWERTRGEAGEWRRGLKHWRRRLADAPTELELPADGHRSPLRTVRGGRRTLRLRADATDRLRQFARERGATTFMVLVAALDVVLARLSGIDDVVVGFPISNRDRPELEDVVGIFLNTLPLRVSTAGDIGFGALLERVREAALEAYVHRRVPFERILEEIQPERDLRRSPLFQVFVNSLTLPRRARRVAGLDVSVEPPDTVPAKFDLTLYIEEEGPEIRCDAVYDAGLFSPRRVETMLQQLEAVLLEGVTWPERRIAEIDLRRGPAERFLPHPEAELPCRWPGSLAARFARHAAERPDAPAISGPGESWTYRELEEVTADLARRLRVAGVEPGELVAVHARRTAALVPALLSVVRSGAAFLVLDADHPPAWQLARLRAAPPRAWLSAGVEEPAPALAEVVAGAGLRTRLRVPDAPGQEAGGTPLPDAEPAPEPRLGPGTLAYAAFTSGSTGEPKVVLGDHGPLAHFLDWHAETFRLGGGDRFSVLSGLVHDPLLRDVFTPLWVGGTVCVPGRRDMESADRLAAWLRHAGITVAHLTPSLGRVVAAGAAEPAPELRCVFFGGEALAVDDVVRARRWAPRARVVNFYGTTETPQAVGWYEVPSGAALAGSTIPIGRGIDGAQLLVLGEGARPCGLGELGEIHVRTPHLTRGYAGDEERSRERFLHGVFTPGDRLYRTGDLGRYRPDGTVEHLGRSDRQVQVRGYRVEPAEVESVLTARRDVGEAVVTAVETGGGTALAAYYTSGTSGAPEPDTLRRHLLERLPSPLMPAFFVHLDRLPRTPTGKLDRNALPKPERRPVPYLPPRDAVEEGVATLFAELLGRERVGAEGDFFALGGHSLLATQVVSRVREVFGRELPLRAVFEAPTVAALAARLREVPTVGAWAEVIRRLPRDRGLPLSFAQQRLWLLQQLDPGSATYVIPLALRLRGPLDPSALAVALRRTVERHEVLRTRYRRTPEGPVQDVEAPELRLRLVDLSALPPARRQAEALRQPVLEAGRGFDLEAGPPLRCQLLRLGPAEHLLLLTTHHIAADAWSVAVLLEDLAALYTAARSGRPPELADLAVRYADFAAWQRQVLAGGRLEEDLGYWRRRLEGLPGLDLPADRPRPAVQRHRGASCPVRLDAGLALSLRRLAGGHDGTLFMVLLAGFAGLLWRYSGQADFAVGSPIAGRTRRETESLVGCFVNTVVLRMDLDGGPSFAELLGRVRRTTLGAYAHQELPFDRLVEELRPQRRLDRSPLFQVMFDFHNTPQPRLRLEGLEAEPFEVPSRRARFDLALVLGEEGDGVEGVLEYDRDLFDPTRAERLVDHLKTLLSAAAAAPSSSLPALPWLGAGERQQVVCEWNATGRDYERGATIHALFLAQAASTPDAVAVSFGGRSLSYGELGGRAEAVAGWLVGHGVGADRLVALLVERSLDMIVAIVGILQAGAAYAPLEPGMPARRLRLQLDDLRSPVLLTQAPLLREVAEAGGFDGPVLRLGEDEPAGAGRPEARPPGHPLQLAYVNYTSGSTGRPKGVIVPHAGVLRLVRNPDYIELGPHHGILQLSTYAWDAATFEIWGALLNGGRLVLVERSTLLEFGALVELVRRERIGVLYLTTSLFNRVIEEEGEGLEGLDTLIVGGETASVTHFRRAVRLLPATRVINEYGPSENTSFSTWERVEELGQVEAVSIGRPLANSTAFVTDRELRPLPAGVAGELVLGGDGLARGYLRRPALTAERFVPSPFGAGERLYRSGDLAAWGPDGRLAFLGRMDFQAKIRGHRVEPAEVEVQLREHPAVGDAVVVVHEIRPGEVALAAYVTGVEDAPGALEARALRSYLAERLPDYMVPGTVTVLETLPLAATGKVDRASLPAPQAAEAAGGETLPRTPAQELVAVAFGELFGRRVGLEDDFFDLGGHSLLATRLAARLEEALQVRVPVRAVFEHPTVAGLSALVESLAAGDEAPDPPLVPLPLEGDLPLSSAQERLWFVDRLHPGDPSYNLSLAVRVDGELVVPGLASAFAAVVRRHGVLRASFHEIGGEPVVRVAPRVALPLPVLDLARLPEALRDRELDRLDRAWSARSFDLRRAPLLRAALVGLGPTTRVLLVSVHHIVADGWSLGNLTRELAAGYDGFRGGRRELPALRVQYPDYAAWERARLAAGAADAAEAYWRRRLDPALPALELPTDAAPAPAGPRRGLYRELLVPDDLGARLSALGRTTGASPFMILLSAYGALLHVVTGQERFRVGSPIATRSRSDLEPLIGLFLNTLVLELDLAGDPGFCELVERVRRTTLEAYAHRDLPYQRLVELVGARGQSMPLYRVWFVLQNTPLAELSATGLEMTLLPPQGSVTKFDLALNLVERAGGGFEGRFEFDAGLFRPETVDGLARRLLDLLEWVVEDPRAPLSTLRGAAEARHREETQARRVLVKRTLGERLRRTSRSGRSDETAKGVDVR